MMKLKICLAMVVLGVGLSVYAQQQVGQQQPEQLQIGSFSAYHGLVTAVDTTAGKEMLTLKSRKGDKMKTFSATGAKVTVDKVTATLADVKVGDHARVVTADDKEDVATEIHVWRKQTDQAASAAINATKEGSASEFARKTYTIRANGQTSISLTCQAGKRVNLSVKSTKETDINMYVWSDRLSLIAKDETPGPSCEVSFTPTRTGTYIIGIVNHGDEENRSTLTVK